MYTCNHVHNKYLLFIAFIFLLHSPSKRVNHERDLRRSSEATPDKNLLHALRIHRQHTPQDKLTVDRPTVIEPLSYPVVEEGQDGSFSRGCN